MAARFLTFLLLSCFLILYSCQSELAEIIAAAGQCRINKGYYYGGSGGINDSATFVYSNGRISRIDAVHEYVEYAYQDTNVHIRRFYERLTGNTLGRIDTIDYDGQGRVSRINSWVYPGMWSNDSIHSVMHIAYQGQVPSEVTEAWAYVGMDYDTSKTFFHTDASGNMVKISYGDMQGNITDSTLYSFDSNPNYFRVVHPNYFLFDPFFELQVGLLAHFPYFYSRNNVTNFNVYGSFDNPVEYGLDSLNRMTSVDMGGFEYMKYGYTCP